MTIHKSTTIVGPGPDVNPKPGLRLPRAPLQRGLVLLTVLAGILVVPATAFAGGFTAHLYASTHEPRVGRQRIKVTATRRRQKLSGDVNYQFVSHGTIVARKPGHRFRDGVYRDTLMWPRPAVGHTITLRVVVKTRYGTDYLNWWIRVRA